MNFYLVPLCGACLEGWAELLGTTQCGDCRRDGVPGAVVIAWNAFFVTMFLAWYVYRVGFFKYSDR